MGSIEPADLLLQSQALYLRQDSLAIDQRNESRRLLVRILRRVGRNSRAESRVDAVFELEHRLAELYPEPVAARQPIIAENVFGIASLETTFPEFPWRRFLAARGVVKDTIIQVPPRDQIPELIALFHATPVSVWRDYMTLRLILSYGSYLDEGTDRLVAEFDAARSGIAYTPLKRRERAWRVAADILPDPIGRAYVERYLTDTTVVEVHKIVDWTLLAYRERIEAADWLEAETRRRAIEKLDAITVVVGEPPGWNNFDFFTPIRGSLFSNAYSRQQLRHRSALARLLSSTEDEEDPSAPSKNPLDDIFFSPISVGAYYLPTLNSIVVPAAYLQAPYYDPSASLAVNFGALGTTIGHELGHAFDDQGARRGPDGQITDWWSAKDNEQFVAKGDKLSRHLSAFEAAPGIPLNTALTLGENLSDLVGVEIAFRAMELAHHAGRGEGVAREDAQAFFISYAQKRRAKRLPTIEIDFAYSNLHSPPSVRVNGILPHVDQWYSAFDVSEDDPLWVAPEDRVHIW
ncbi:MAG: M13 family metallopeptidase [Pseudomonadota bacterium]